MPRVDQATRAEVLDAAAQLQALGVHLFPVAHGGKTPAVDGWPETATTDPAVLAEMYRDGQNLGVALGRSRLIVVDADTEPAVDAFKTWKPDGSRRGTHYPGTPTVQTPGNGDDHAGGGHWWVDASGELYGTDPQNRGHVVALEPDALETAAEVTLTAGPESVDVVTAKTGRHYVLVPGSVRDDVADPEHPAYVVAGAVTVPTTTAAPGKSIVRAVANGVVAKAHQAERPTRDRTDRATVAGEPSDIDDWAEGITWAAILEPAGWTLARSVASCGCARWSRPGKSDGSPSATAHDPATCADGFTEVFKVFSGTAVDTYGLEPDRGYNKAQTYAFVNGYDPAAEVRVALAASDHVAPTLPTGQFLDPADAVPLTEEQRQFWLDAAADVADVPAPTETLGNGRRAARGRADLSAVLAGDMTPPSATLLPRSDGVGLIYPGKTHSFHGEPESGKSLLLQAETARLIRDGRAVLYLDFEDTAEGVASRLVEDMGVPADMVAEHLDYWNPEPDPSDRTQIQDMAEMLAERYALVVIDGVTDALALHGYGPNAAEDVAKWSHDVPARLAKETGAGVAVIDHVTKSTADRGRMAVGSYAKMATLSGAAYTVDVEDVAGRGRVGTLTIYVGKDRPGGVRQHAGTPGRDRTQAIATVTVDGRDDSLTVTVKPPESSAPKGTGQTLDGAQHTGPTPWELYLTENGITLSRPSMVFVLTTFVDADAKGLTLKGVLDAWRTYSPTSAPPPSEVERAWKRAQDQEMLQQGSTRSRAAANPEHRCASKVEIRQALDGLRRCYRDRPGVS